MNWNLYKKKDSPLYQLWLCETIDERLRWYSGIRVNKKDWDKGMKSPALSSVKAEIELIERIYPEIKKQLDKKNMLTASNAHFLLNCENIYKADNYIDEIIECINHIPVKGEFIECFERFIKDSETGKRKKKKGGRIQANTIKKYNVAFNFIKRFGKETGYPLAWKHINYEFYEKLCDFGWNVAGHYDNHLGTIINTFISFLNWCGEEKIITSKIHDSRWVAWKEEEVDALVLYPDEIPILYEMPLEDELHDQVRDLFIFGCLTLLRGGNLLSLTESDLKVVGNTWYINPIQVKVGGKVWIKLHSIAVDIIKKYRGKYNTLLPDMKHAMYANHLKVLARKFRDHLRELELPEDVMTNEWNKPFTRVRYRQGKPIKVQVSIVDIFNPHCERSTGITNLLIMGGQEFMVKQLGGFSKNSSAFNKYVRFAQRIIDSNSDQAWDKMFNGKPHLRKAI
jgi:hypothetical protein